MGYLGMVGGANPCSEDKLVYVDSGLTLRSFEDSPYGFTFDFPVTTLIPYLVDTVTLAIEYRPDLAIAAPGPGEIVLNDSTIVGTIRGPVSGSFPLTHFTHELFVISRSGIAIAYSGPQQAAEVSATVGSPFICRIDDTHFVRAYVPHVPITGPTGAILETFSVSGGTISLDNSEDLTPAPGGSIVTRDPGPGTAAMSPFEFLPFHYDGSGRLFVHTMSQRLTAPFSTHFVVGAVPYTPGGGVGTIGLSTRVDDAHEDLIRRGPVYAAKIGSSECVPLTVGGGRVPFYDDGSMHFDINPASSFDHIDHGINSVGETPHADYLSSSFTDPAPGSPVFNAITEQSGTSLMYTPIEPIFLCFNPHSISGVRHGANLGCQIGSNPFNSDPILEAYRW